MINAQALIEKFEYALDNQWGYIWGTAGIAWTQAKQDQKVQYMVNKYGTNWKINSEAKDDDYYYAALYGSKWIGHTVADCSGLFAWAFSKLGGSIAHGSNSIYDRYCSEKGSLDSAKKKSLLPGTAVFTATVYNKGKPNEYVKHNHIGLYIGNGKVIEASGTQAGVCISNITAGKWSYYGLLKDVNYSVENKPSTPSEQKDQQKPVQTFPTLRKGDKGDWVKVLQNELISRGYSCGSKGADGIFGDDTLKAVKMFQKDNGLTQDGIAGSKTWNALSTATKTKYCTVVVKNIPIATGNEIIKKYGGTLTEEG